jgi:hypothetical protein
MASTFFGVLRNSLRITLAGTVAITALTIPAASAEPSAAATLTCKDAVDLFGVNQDGTAFTFPHQEPENGNYVWGEFRGNLGTDWNVGRMVAGPDGVVYSMVGTGDGQLRRFHWNGTAWDNMDGTSQYRGVGTGWTRFSEAEHRNKVTVDQQGRLYAVNAAGELRVYIWDDTTQWWVPGTEGGKVLDSGWNQYDLIVAAGDGVLYARKNGELFRFRWHADSDRWLQYAVSVDQGWEVFNRVFSAGGDILYGTRADNGGELVWYQYLEASGSWANDGIGKVVGNGWYDDFDVAADTNGCRLSGSPVPDRPTITPADRARTSMIQGDDGRMNYFYVATGGVLGHSKQRNTTEWTYIDNQSIPDYGNYSGQPAVAAQQDGKLEVHTHSHENSDVLGVTQAVKNGAWQANETLLGGRMLSDPVLAKGSNGVLTSFAVANDGILWSRTQLAANGTFLPWRRLGGQNLTADFSVVTSGTGFEVAARHTDGSVRVARVTENSLGTWRSLGGTDATGIPALVLHTDGKLQVVVRRADGVVHTKREVGTSFPAAWQTIPGLSIQGSPAAVATTSGTVEISAWGGDDFVYTSGNGTIGGSYRAWVKRESTDRPAEQAGTSPSMANLPDGTWALTWRTPAGDLYLWRGAIGSAKRDGATAAYNGGKART